MHDIKFIRENPEAFDAGLRKRNLDPHDLDFRGAGPKLPSDANAHGPNERLRLSDLPLASEIVALACYDLLAKGN